MWLAFLTRNDLLNKDDLPEELNNSALQKALNVLDIMNFSKHEREAYEDHLKWLMIESNTLKKAEDKGRAEGRAEGKAEGIEIGEAKLKEERINLAKKMLAIKEPTEKIIEFTGLTKEEIENLR